MAHYYVEYPTAEVCSGRHFAIISGTCQQIVEALEYYRLNRDAHSLVVVGFIDSWGTYYSLVQYQPNPSER